MFRITIEVTEPGRRVDGILLSKLRESAPELSRARLKERFQAGDVRRLVSGASQGEAAAAKTLDASDELPIGEHELEVRGLELTGPQAQAPAAAEPFLPVVFEDENLLVLNKLSGVPSVPQRQDETRTACGSALAYLPALRHVGRGGYEPGILHRLDTATSGLIAFAKTQAEFERMRGLWKSGGVRKIYRALSRPRDADATGALAQERLPLRIDTPLGHDPKSSRRMVAVTHPGVRTRGASLEALSWIRAALEHSAGLWDLEIEIGTGVMHQIRCHLASLGLPLLGDTLYRGVPSRRLWLHAWRLSFPLASGTQLTLQSELPEGWPAG